MNRIRNMNKCIILFLGINMLFICSYAQMDQQPGFKVHQERYEAHWDSLKQNEYRYDANWESLKKYTVPNWFRDAKFGIFIHWGVYAVAEHHDGFAMYKTSLSRWNAYDMGPHQDIIGELAKAIRKEGLIFGLSSHRAEHWFFLYHGRLINSDVNDPKYQDFYGPAEEGGYDFPNHKISTEFLNNWLLRSTELVDKYHPQIFWFDEYIDRPGFQPYLKTFAAYYYNHGLQWGKKVVLNYKYNAFPDSAAVLDIERGKEKGIRQLPWQSDDAVAYNSWAYVENEHYKSAQYLVDELIDIVSKNGNLLLNIGTKSDGTIPEEQQTLLVDIGKWLKVNGEAIYGTRPWTIYGEGPAKSIGGDHIDKKVKPYTQEDIRFTTRGKTLYAIPLVIPDGGIRIESLSNKDPDLKIASVELVGSKEKIRWSQGENGLAIKAVKNYPSKYAPVFKIKFIKKTN